jgi:gamma-glutamyl:cysteine ligase YbdK (ATP-grasp superfamily)
VAIVPHILTAANVAERIYALVQKIQADRVQSRHRDILLLQDDIDSLREAVELQARYMAEKDREIAELRRDVQEMRAKRRWFSR